MAESGQMRKVEGLVPLVGARVRIPSPAYSHMRTGPTNQQLKTLIDELRSESYAKKIPLLGRIAKDLAKPTRQRRTVNLSKINRFCQNGETIVVPGKVLAGGELNKEVTIVAYQFSKEALEKILKAKSKAVDMRDLVKQETKGKRVKIIG